MKACDKRTTSLWTKTSKAELPWGVSTSHLYKGSGVWGTLQGLGPIYEPGYLFKKKKKLWKDLTNNDTYLPASFMEIWSINPFNI